MMRALATGPGLRMEDYRGTIYDFADTTKMRGAWLVMLINSAEADASTQQERAIFCRQIRSLYHRFPCSECKEHFGEYIDRSPPERATFLPPDGLFDWIVECMNNINRRLKKPLYSRDVLYDMFHGDGAAPCSSYCTAENAIAPADKRPGGTFSQRVPRQ